MMYELELRAQATTATQKRFEGKPFDWSKAATCVHLLRYHGRKMGHKMPTVPRFSTVLTAKRALKSMGHKDLISVMDSMFPRIPPASMRIGDIMAVEGDAGFHALLVRGSASKFLGWHEDADGCTIIDADIGQAVGAWRL